MIGHNQSVIDTGGMLFFLSVKKIQVKLNQRIYLFFNLTCI